jgi:hypothetical protein
MTRGRSRQDERRILSGQLASLHSVKEGGGGSRHQGYEKNSVKSLGYVGCGTNGTIRTNLGNNNYYE